MYYGGGDHQTAEQVSVWLFISEAETVDEGLDAAFRLYACFVCDTKALLQQRYVACGAV